MSTRPLANLFSTWVKSAGGKNVRPAAPARRLLGISHFLALKSCSFVLTSSSDWLVMVSFVPISPCNYFASFFTTEGSDKFYLSLLKSFVEICLNMDAKTSDHWKYIFRFFFGTKSAVLKLTLKKLLKGNGRWRENTSDTWETGTRSANIAATGHCGKLLRVICFQNKFTFMLRIEIEAT